MHFDTDGRDERTMIHITILYTYLPVCKQYLTRFLLSLYTSQVSVVTTVSKLDSVVRPSLSFTRR